MSKRPSHRQNAAREDYAPCTACKAGRGRPCVTYSGYARKPHEGRAVAHGPLTFGSDAPPALERDEAAYLRIVNSKGALEAARKFGAPATSAGEEA